MITGVGHYGANGGTRDIASTTCRSRRGITAVDSCIDTEFETNVACFTIMHIHNNYVHSLIYASV